jgi:hypothetical protein
MFPRNFKIFAVTLLLVLGIGALVSTPRGVFGAPIVPQEPCPSTNPNCNNTGGNRTTRPQSAVVTVATNTSLYASTVTLTIKFYNPNSTIQPYWIYRSESYFSKSNATLVGSGSINPYQSNANMIVSFSDTVANAAQTEAYGIYLGPTTNLSSVKVVNFNLSTGTGGGGGPTINNPNYAPMNQVGSFLDTGSTTQVKAGTLSIANSVLSNIGISLLPSGAVNLIDPLSYTPKGGMYYDSYGKNFYVTATTNSFSGSPEWGCGMSFDSSGNIDITSAVGQWVQVGTQSYVGNNAFGGENCPAFGDTEYIPQYVPSCTYYYDSSGDNYGAGSCSSCPSGPYKIGYPAGCYPTLQSGGTTYLVKKWEPTGTALSVPGGSTLTVNGVPVPMRGTWCGFVTHFPSSWSSNFGYPPTESVPCEGILPSNGCPAGYEHKQWGYAGNTVDTCFKK